MADKNNGHTVIMGCSKLSVTIALSLVETSSTVSIIDLRRETFDLVPPNKLRENLITPVHGDGTQNKTLLEASIENARCFVALTNSDLSNALAAQIAKHMFGVPTAMSKFNDPILQNIYNQLGISGISNTDFIRDMVLNKVME